MVTGESPDYSNQPVSVLREMCRGNWAWTMDDSGRKAELLQRIAVYDQQGSEGSDGCSDGSGGRSGKDSDDGDGEPAAARRRPDCRQPCWLAPNSPASTRKAEVVAAARCLDMGRLQRWHGI